MRGDPLVEEAVVLVVAHLRGHDLEHEILAALESQVRPADVVDELELEQVLVAFGLDLLLVAQGRQGAFAASLHAHDQSLCLYDANGRGGVARAHMQSSLLIAKRSIGAPACKACYLKFCKPAIALSLADVTVGAPSVEPGF